MTFIIRNSDNAPVVSLDGAALTFTVQEDPTNEWWSDSRQLVAGKLYKFATNDVPLENIFWKTPTSAITAIPSSALIPDFAPQQAGPSLIALKKTAMLVSGFELSADEIHFLDENKGEFDGLDFNMLTLQQWLRLDAYTRLRNSLSQTKINILDFWKWTYDAASRITSYNVCYTKLLRYHVLDFRGQGIEEPSIVITSYSIHYTKLYDQVESNH